MKNKLHAIVFALLGCIMPCMAQNDLTVVLKDGSEMTGYISSQRPGENIIFFASESSVMMPTTNILSIVDTNTKIDDLSDKWIEWAEKNDAFIGAGENRSLILSNIIVKDELEIRSVRILEHGENIRYLDLSPRKSSLAWDSIREVRVEKRPKLLLSGINRNYTLVSGKEMEGQYVGEIPGKAIYLYRDNGIIEVFNPSEIVHERRYAVNPNQTLLEQSDLLDIISMKDGRRTTSCQGVIFERAYSYGKDKKDDYLMIMLEDGTVKRFSLADIDEYRKIPNPHYSPVTDILLKSGEFVINRSAVSLQTTVVKDKYVTFNTDSLSVYQKGDNETVVVLETRFDNPSQSQQFKMVRAYKYFDKKGKNYFYGFTFEEYAMSPIFAEKVETSVNHTTKMQFNLPSDGVYVFYNPQTQQAVPFRIAGDAKNE